jgi:hypothetical protein
MRTRALLVLLALFARSASAAEPHGADVPRTMPVPVPPGTRPAGEDPETSIVFEVRILKVPAGFCDQVGLKSAGTTVLAAAQLRQVLEAAQDQRDAVVTQLPKITAADGQTARVGALETRDFVTGVEAVKANGETVFVPKSKSIELGDRLVITGRASADGTSVRVAGALTRVRLAGDVELVPIVTQITPVFEGGARGTPVPFTQFLQAPDVRTEQVEKTATVPAGSTLVLGRWKEIAPAPVPPTKGKGLFKRQKKERPAEYEVVALATVGVQRTELAPAPREVNQPVAFHLARAAAADAAGAVVRYLDGKKLKARVAADVANNKVWACAESEVIQQIADILRELDTQP